MEHADRLTLDGSVSGAQHQSTARILMLGNGPPDAFGSEIFYTLVISSDELLVHATVLGTTL